MRHGLPEDDGLHEVHDAERLEGLYRYVEPGTADREHVINLVQRDGIADLHGVPDMGVMPEQDLLVVGDGRETDLPAVGHLIHNRIVPFCRRHRREATLHEGERVPDIQLVAGLPEGAITGAGVREPCAGGWIELDHVFQRSIAGE